MRVLLIAYDNGSHIPFFPLNLAYLAASLKDSGHVVRICQQDIDHSPDSEIAETIRFAKPDVVGLGFVGGYFQYAKAKSIAAVVNSSESRRKFKFVIGGHGPGAAPEYFLDKLGADHVIVGDGEDAIMSIDDPIICGGRCRPDGWPEYHLFPVDTYKLHRFPNSSPTDFTMPMLSGRGCPFSCSFCYRMTPGFWPRDVEDVVAEMEMLNEDFKINHFQFADELLMSSKARAVEFSEAIMRLPFKVKWDCNGRLNYADKEVLFIMKRSGCNYINYGVEAMDDDVLRRMNKHLTVDATYQGVEATIAAGITPGLNLIWGSPGDTTQTLQKAVEFLLRYDGISELRTIRPVTPYPGTALFDLAIDEGLIDGVEDFYERKHINSDLFTVSFMEGITPREADLHLMKANERLVSAYYGRLAIATNARSRAFYSGEIKEFRGYRPV